MKKRVSALALFIFLSMILKSAYVKFSIMHGLTMAGLLAEISFLALAIFFLSTLSPRISVLLLVLFNVIYTISCLTALIFFDYYNTIFTYKSLTELDQVGAIKDSVFALFNKEYLFLFTDFLLIIFIRVIRVNLSNLYMSLNKKTVSLMLAASSIFIFFGVTQSSQSVSELNKFDSFGLIGYQFLEAGSELHSKFISEQHISAETLNKKRKASIRGPKQLSGVNKGNNLIIVQLESVQNFLLNLSIDGHEVTPNLNKLLQTSWYFPKVFTQVGKGNTSDAEFITNTSVYANGDTPMSSAVEGKKVPSLPRVLAKYGYHTATFHANSVKFWNRDRLYRAIGFDEYYDKNYFGTSDVISYGVSDEIMYQKTAEKLSEFNNKGQKFYAHVIALSSHFPYRLPQRKLERTVPLPDRFNGSIIGSYIKAVSYADYAFGEFINELKKQGLYDNSVLIVYGDHQGLQTKTQEDKKLVREMFNREYNSPLDHLNIPLIIHTPETKNAEVIHTPGGLIDIYPTAANLLGLNLTKEMVFGTDLLNAKDNIVGIRFYAPTGTYINGKVSFTPGKTNGEGRITNIDTRKTLPADKESIKQMNEILEYMKLSDGFVKSLKK